MSNIPPITPEVNTFLNILRDEAAFYADTTDDIILGASIQAERTIRLFEKTFGRGGAVCV